MKIRIKGNAIRIRLTKTEVEKLASTGYLEETTLFPVNTFVYALQAFDEATLSASFINNKITMFVPAEWSAQWADNDVVGIKNLIDLPGGDTLLLLLEKDFVCLDETTEDQSDNYANPNKIC